MSLAHLAAAVCLVLPAFSDTVTLVDGTELDGEIVTQTDELLILRTKVGGIWDEKRLSLGEVRSIERESPEAKAWKEAKVSLPTPDLMSRAEYREMIDTKLKPFLEAFPSGEHAAKAKEQLDVLESELAKVIDGDVKFNGVWMSAEEYNDRKYWVDSERIYRDLKASAQRGSLVTALRRFHDLETNYENSVGYALAVPEIRTVLEQYDRELTTAIIRAPGLLEQRTEMLKTLPPAERKITEKDIERSDKEAKARMDKERTDGVKWLTPNPYDESFLKSIQATVRKEMERIAELEPAVLERRAGVLELIDRMINEGRLEKAQELIAEHEDLLKRSKYRSALETKLQELIKEREQATTIETTDPEPEDEGTADGEEKDVEGEEEEEPNAGDDESPATLTDAQRRQAEAAKKDKETEGESVEDSTEPDAEEVTAEGEESDEKVASEAEKPAKPEKQAPKRKAANEDDTGFNPVIIGVLVALVLVIIVALVAKAKGKKEMAEEE